MATFVLLDALGGIALLLWGLHMVQTGILRAFGGDLRTFLGHALANRFRAFGFGIVLTAILQSSTATALMTAGLTAGGVVALPAALAVMLGANVGTTLIVQLLSFDVAKLAPALLLIGVIVFKQGKRTRVRDLGRVAIGLGLMLLSLHTLLITLAPAEDAPAVRDLLTAITADPVLNILVGAIFAWLAHSSVAVVVLVMSLGYSHFVTPAAALALVLGANLGSAINPLVEAGGAGNPAARRLPVGNLVNRLVGCLLVLPFIHPLADLLGRLDPNPTHQIADFHTGFNLVLAALFIVPIGPLARLLTRLFPAAPAAADPGTPLHLDPEALSSPAVALTCAEREVLHMGDLVEAMLRQTMTAFGTDDRKLVAEIERMDNAVDKLDQAIKLYVTAITRDNPDDSILRRASEVIAFSINLEHVGDIIDRNLMELAGKKIRHRYKFSPEGAAELEAFHRKVLDNLKLALGVFMSGDVGIARQLLHGKADVRSAEWNAAENHFARLREGRPESIETSSLHLDVLRDLKRIHSHICAAAYPVLEAKGELAPTRLRVATGED